MCGACHRAGCGAEARVCLSTCSERGSISSSHGKAKKELQDMAEAMKVRLAGEAWRIHGFQGCE